MKILIAFTLMFSLNSFAQTTFEAKKEPQKKDDMDYGDKQLLRRDTCRKPMEYLETRYPNKTKEELAKMKKECAY